MKIKSHHRHTTRLPLAERERTFRQVKQFPCSVIKAIWELSVLMSKLTEVRQKWFTVSKHVRGKSDGLYRTPCESPHHKPAVTVGQV